MAGAAKPMLGAVAALLLAGAQAGALPASAVAEQASQPSSLAAGRLDVGAYHSCAVLGDGIVRCWGYAGNGQVGYGNKDDVGDDEVPASVGPVDLGAGRTANVVSAGDYHTCALLDDGGVRCWGYGADGRLGYGNTNNVGDQQTPGSVGPVNLGVGRTALAISAGGAHTCAILDNGSVLCWGYGATGQLGYGNTSNVGDVKTPGAVGPVDLGGKKAVAISAGAAHTCAILENGKLLCWGFGGYGRLGYGDTKNVGDQQTPGSVGPVDLGAGRTAVAVSAGGAHTCVILDNGRVLCWGYAGLGQLGYGNTTNTGSTLPASAGPVDFGPGRTAVAISAGQIHTCAILDDRSVRCWGFGNNGRLGYGNTTTIGDLQTPASVGAVDLGPGRTAVAITAGQAHTCARLDNGAVRCWGSGANARLGYCNQDDVGATQTPGSVGPVSLLPGDGGAACPAPPSRHAPAKKPSPPVDADTARARRLRNCLAGVARDARRARSRARRGSPRRRAQTRRRLARLEVSGRRRCLRLYGRTPGRVTGLHAKAVTGTQIILTFKAAGTDANNPPAAQTYLIKQSLRPIRKATDLAHAPTLCHGRCSFKLTTIGTTIRLTIVHLRPHTTYYYYAVAARDNVSSRTGPLSSPLAVRTR